MLSTINAKLKVLKDYNRIAKIDRIARRYFVMNAFDGVLAIMGILIGSYIVGSHPKVVISTSIGAGIAMGVSGIWGAYLTERAERQREIRELERATLSKLSETKIGRAATAAVFIIAIIDGLAPFLSALIILLPFLLLSPFLTVKQMYIYSAAIAFSTLFLLGAFLGRISKESMIKTGLIMILAGVVSGGISIFVLGAENLRLT
ncbi:hypothetical protein HY640_02820 [Candidatus Woesearchaeota archaeon]|nr:hypothetical protein [Candidatus Woesearchaeota archaeon]